MAEWNKQGKALAEIFGGALPQGATSCSTHENDEIVFLIGETGQFVHVVMTPAQKEAVLAAGMMGSFGFEIAGPDREGEGNALSEPAAKPLSPKERLLEAIATKDKELERVLAETAPEATAAMEALASGRGMLKKLRDVVEHDAAVSAISSVFSELKESGLPVGEFDAEIKA
ncbi:MAG TPA: hypothetical protein VF450_11700, partial [Noviherbaspirillum sp.]